MSDIVRIALANLPFASSPDESVICANQAIAEASAEHADVICFPEAYVPGYRAAAKPLTPADSGFLDRAWAEIARAALAGDITVILGTERVVDDRLLLSALVINRDGSLEGFQDKVQIDPSEESHTRWIRPSGLSGRVTDVWRGDLP